MDSVADPYHKDKTTGFTLKPHEGLPVEILAEIFLHCNEGNSVIPLKRNDRYERCRQLPWALGRVCSRWRQVALKEPRLWNRVQIPHSLFLQKLKGNHYVNMTELVFSRSGRLPLSYSTSLIELDLQKETNPLPNLILPYADRFREISIQSSYFWLRSILELPPGLFQNLEKLELGFRKPYFTDSTITSTSLGNAFGAARLLRSLHIEAKHHDAIHFDTSSTRVFWDKLEYVTFEGLWISPSGGLHFLEHHINLVECTLELNQDTPQLPTNRRIILPHLKSLILKIRTNNFGGVFASLALPSLKKLVVETYGLGTWWVQDELLGMLKSSSCELEIFHTTLYIRPENLIALLEAITTITTLSIPSSIVPDTMMAAMIRSELAPSLQAIYCIVGSVNLFLDLLEARWAQSCTDTSPFFGIRAATVYFNNTRNAITISPAWLRYQTLHSTFLQQGRDIVLIAR